MSNACCMYTSCMQYYGTGECFVFNLSDQTRKATTPATTPTRASSRTSAHSTPTTTNTTASTATPMSLQPQQQQHSTTPVVSPKAAATSSSISASGNGCTTVVDQRRTFSSLHKYLWAGLNPYFQFSSETTLGLGGGGDGFSLFVGEDFSSGTSCRSQTFDNEALCSASDFEVSQLEVWGFTRATTEVAARVETLKKSSRRRGR
jgi:TLD